MNTLQEKKQLEIHRTQFHYGTRDYMYHSVAIENIVMDVKKPYQLCKSVSVYT